MLLLGEGDDEASFDGALDAPPDEDSLAGAGFEPESAFEPDPESDPESEVAGVLPAAAVSDDDVDRLSLR